MSTPIVYPQYQYGLIQAQDRLETDWRKIYWDSVRLMFYKIKLFGNNSWSMHIRYVSTFRDCVLTPGPYPSYTHCRIILRLKPSWLSKVTSLLHVSLTVPFSHLCLSHRRFLYRVVHRSVFDTSTFLCRRRCLRVDVFLVPSVSASWRGDECRRKWEVRERLRRVTGLSWTLVDVPHTSVAERTGVSPSLFLLWTLHSPPYSCPLGEVRGAKR